MLRDQRAAILKYGVPKGLLKSFEQAVSDEVTAKFQRRLDAADNRALRWADEGSDWRLRYMAEREKTQQLELLHSVKDQKNAQQMKVIGKLSVYIKWLRTQVFGEKSERGASEPKPPETAAVSQAPGTKPKRGKKPGAAGHGRDRDSVEPEPVNHDLEEKDKFCRCGGEYELTDLQPVASYETHLDEKITVRQHLRRKSICRCKKCGRSAGIKTAKKPPKLIPKGKYSPELWRFLLEEKYWLQRPLNRVITKLKSLGAKVRPGTITNGFHKFYTARLFEVVYEAILHRSQIAEQRNMDETGWKVFPDSGSEKSSHWYMWVSVTCDATVFVLDSRRSNEVIAEHLQGVTQGIIICDRHSAYKCFVKNNEGFLIAFCWIHQRRDIIKLRDGYPEHSEWAQAWLTRIEALRSQNQVRVQAIGSPEQFQAQDSILRKMVDEMKKTIDKQLADKSLAKERIDELSSLLNHWAGLTVFVDHPLVPMDNNAAERALRDAVLGRKSYYGSRSLWSGQQTSWLFTIYATLEQNGIDPHRWMGDYLQACAKNNGLPPNDKDLKKFLPWNYKQTAAMPPPMPQNGNTDLQEARQISNDQPEPFSVSILPAAVGVTVTKPLPP